MARQRQPLSGRIGDADIRLQRIFRAVVENGGFSAAEIELGMSISAISIAVADLEKRLGLRLCQRGRAGFALTEEGEQIYQAILQVMGALENFRTEVNSIHAHLKGELNIGITDNLVSMSENMRVTDALGALKRRGGEVRINIHMMPPAEIEKGVLDGRLHVGVIPEVKALAGLEYLDLYDEQSRLYCGHTHSLFGRPATRLREKDVVRQDAVVARGVVPDAARALQARLKASATATDREGIAFLLLTGEYIGFLPTHYAGRWVAEKRMRELLPRVFSYRTRFQAITRRGQRLNLVLQTFMEELGETCRG